MEDFFVDLSLTLEHYSIHKCMYYIALLCSCVASDLYTYLWVFLMVLLLQFKWVYSQYTQHSIQETSCILQVQEEKTLFTVS